MLALDRRANAGLARAFREHRVRRTYAALCEGHVDAGTWSWDVDGKRARTDVEVEEARPDGVTAVVCRLHTGRTHQIRVHAAMNGTPLLGDRRYGGDLARPWDRLGLHAARLELVHPLTGEELAFEVPAPWAQG
ncbi:MAG: hypothetical protein KC656_12890 [Myxococcales bacterium]|nr:hypothetical protein [Myxococcales bacterium]